MVIKQLNLDIEVGQYSWACCYIILIFPIIQLKDVDFDKNEHKSPEFFLLNPLHQVPTLDDNGFYVTDSHAIIAYLATDSKLTSPDPRVLARINQLMFFDFELFRVMGEVGVSSIVFKVFRQLIRMLLDSTLRWFRSHDGSITESIDDSARKTRSFGTLLAAAQLGGRWLFDHRWLLGACNFFCNLRELNFELFEGWCLIAFPYFFIALSNWPFEVRCNVEVVWDLQRSFGWICGYRRRLEGSSR